MLHETFDIRNEKSGSYANLSTYILDTSEEISCKRRPMIILCPGGGYCFTSKREGELMAMQFLAAGINAAVLWYSVAPAVFPTALLELGRSVALVREHADAWYVDTDNIIVEGCSAGGHLAASYGVFWHEDFVSDSLGVSKELLKINGLMLSYPVITSGEYAHRGSFEALLNGMYTEEMLHKTSLEFHVNQYVPRTFLWHTYDDDCVPVENSLLFIGALRKHKIPVEFHMYEHGQHGLSLANDLTRDASGGAVQPECTPWIDAAITWVKKNC